MAGGGNGKNGGSWGGGGTQYFSKKDKEALGVTDEDVKGMSAQEAYDAKQKARQALGMVFDDVNKANHYLASPAFRKTLTDQDVSLIERYTSGETPNYAIRYALSGKKPLSEGMQEYITSLDNTLQKFPAFRGTVSRGIEVPQRDLSAFLKEHAKGSVITSKQYLSSGVNYAFTKETGAVSTNVTYSIHAKGKRGRAIFNVGVEKADNEVIFERGTRFKVLQVKKRDNGAHITMEEV